MIFDTAAAISGVRPGRQGAQAVFVGLAEQPVAQAADGQVADRGEGLFRGCR
jgi:hypothetical protein